MSLKRWKLIESNKDSSYRVFDLRVDKAVSPRTNKPYEFYVLESGPWVNIIPLTSDNDVVFIKQYRHGIRDFTLEIPGGMVEPEDTPEGAAIRELKEETGYITDNVEFLGKVHPNPAILNNECYTYLARDVKNTYKQQLDEKEDIEVLLIPLKQVTDLIQKQKITHSLVICAFTYLILKYPHLFNL
ncbi:NUDIX hydrolase [Desulfothermus sp.]